VFVPVSFDPRTLPIHSIADELSIDAAQLSAAALRTRFQRELHWSPEKTDEHLLHEKKEFKAASVLMPIVIRETGLYVLLTERASHLRHHAGQISFPGGRVDESDTSPEHTALREAQEEVGIQADQVEILGNLPQYFTGTGFEVTPVVALIFPPLMLRTDPHEVAAAFEVPLSFLMNPCNHQRRQLAIGNGKGVRTFYAMPYQEFFIWGATAGILRNLFHFLNVDLTE
jgi:8-oxo-dGTP pyrophosphatase MutT (NUDIX family)